MARIMGGNFSIIRSGIRLWRKRKFKLVESIRESANTIHNFFDAMEEEGFADLEVQEEVSNE